MKGRMKGFTLLEALACLALLALLAGFALPAMNGLVEASRAATGINWLVRAVNTARSAAVTQGVMTTLCPTEDDQQCGGAWHGRLMVFTDRNGDRRINGDDQAIAYLDFPSPGATVTWRSFRNRQFLQITPLGFTNNQNGNFVYCSRDQAPELARQLVINLQGRTRSARDRDGDGIVEDRNNRALRC